MTGAVPIDVRRHCTAAAATATSIVQYILQSERNLRIIEVDQTVKKLTLTNEPELAFFPDFFSAAPFRLSSAQSACKSPSLTYTPRTTIEGTYSVRNYQKNCSKCEKVARFERQIHD